MRPANQWRGFALIIVPLLIVASVVFTPAGTRAAEPQPRETLTVFAASSLKESFEQLRTEFRRQNPNVEIQLTFAGSQELRQKIEQGAPADVFASADRYHMDVLTERGLVKNPEVFAHNELVIVVPKDNPAKIASVADLKTAKRVAMGADAVPVGRYSEEMLTRASREDPDLKPEVMSRALTREPNVRLVLNDVASGKADAGIVYRTDARTMPDKIEIVEIPAEWNIIASYPIAVVTKSKARDTAARFVQFVRSVESQKLLTAKGFQPVTRVPAPTGAQAPEQPPEEQPPIAR